MSSPMSDHWKHTASALDQRLTEALDCLEDCLAELREMEAEGLPGTASEVVERAERLLGSRCSR